MKKLFMLKKINFTHKTILLVGTAFFLILYSQIESYAHEYEHGELTIYHPYSQPNRPGLENGVMYIVKIKNNSKKSHILKKITSPVAKSCEIHNMKINKQSGLMKMRRITSLIIPANEVVSLKKGNKDGYHIMLIGLKRNLNVGEKFYATMFFENMSPIKVDVEVSKLKNHQH